MHKLSKLLRQNNLKKSDQTQTIAVKQSGIMNTRPTTCQTTRVRAIPLAILFAFIATAPTLLAQFSLGGLGGDSH